MKIKKYSYKYDLDRALKLIDYFGARHNSLSIKNDFGASRTFMINSYSDYNERKMIEPVNFAFLIPTRASRFSEDYWHEVYEFLPALKHLDVRDAFQILCLLPPLKLEMYGKPGDASSGVLVFVPVFADMLKDYRSNLIMLRQMRKRVNDAVSFAKRAYGINYVGLGATLPRITNYGRTVKESVICTTGHAGTAALISMICTAVIGKAPRSDLKVGFIGGGAIGLASMKALVKKYPSVEFVIYDKRPEVNEKNKKILADSMHKCTVAKNNNELIASCQVIVSAITSKLSVEGLDLQHKVIVDDSQPGSFDRTEVERQGGKLIWVVGHDNSKKQIVSRRGGYSYGPSGLCEPSDVWGCEAEVASIATLNKPELAVKDAVSIEQVELFEDIFKKLGIAPAEYQSFGRHIN